MKKRWMKTLRDLVTLPTAAFREQEVIEYIRRWAEERRIDFRQDAVGNIVLQAGRPDPARRWVFSAHLDHPGFVTTRQQGRSVWAEFRGGVSSGYFKGAAVWLFAPDGPVRAEVQTVRLEKATRRRKCRLQLDRETDVPPGTVGMWDVDEWDVRNGVVHCRACDDLAGVAAVLCALDELNRSGQGSAAGLLTRAEEEGFVGALAACENRTLTEDGTWLVAIETSAAQPAARLGDGVVIRVGDKTRIFDPTLTGHVTKIATQLGKRDRYFSFIRRLMPGGTCESTAYCALGYRATGLCLPLGNYHNMGSKKIEAEQIHQNDYAGLVKLLVALAESDTDPEDTDAALRERLGQILESKRAEFDAE
ncbi:MAG: M20/M25/M40 family metallo-hydrolase [Phycisphaerae bacterium]